jgi:hypothetical protein
VFLESRPGQEEEDDSKNSAEGFFEHLSLNYIWWMFFS